MSPPNQIHNLFEFANKISLSETVNEPAFEEFLDKLWQKREEVIEYGYKGISEEELFNLQTQKQQRFLTFLKNSQIKSRNFIGIIRFGNQTFNLLPKIFYQEDRAYTETEVQAIQAHQLWWLSYCSKFKFPKTFSGYNFIKSNFFEVLIYLFASLTRNSLNHTLYQTYQEIQEERQFMKGRLNTSAYLTDHISKAQWHKFSCTFDSFEINNLYNQIVKYVAKLLLANSQNQENKKLLQEIVFLLDEVTDVRITTQDCSRVQINPLFKDMGQILDYCKLFLTNSTVLSYKNNFQVFAFLLPTEYIFENFIYGFIKKHLHEYFDEITYQKSNAYLATLHKDGEKIRDVFQLQHDIFLRRKTDKKALIVDCKYKVIFLNQSEVDNQEYDPTYGIAQSDLYQLTAYAIRRGIDELFLFYPVMINDLDKKDKHIHFQIENMLNDEKKINIYAHQLPIIQNLDIVNVTTSLKENFFTLEANLKHKLRSVFLNKPN